MNMKFRAIYKESSSVQDEVLGEFKDKKSAINALIRRGDGNYCLDNKEDRIEALEMRNFCMCGCGPASMCIEEIEVE